MVDIVGFTGAAGSGKDTAAQALPEYVQVRFAEPVYWGVLALDPVIDVVCEEDSYSDSYSFYRLSELVASVGWDKAKEDPEVRRLLQVYGTESGRDIHGKDCWINIAKNRIRQHLTEAKRVKVTDVRFENEALALAGLKACIIRVVGPQRREGVDSSHASEAGITDAFVSWTVVNDGTVEDLHRKVRYCVEQGCNKECVTI